MEAALFTLDVFLLLMLIRAVRLADRSTDAKPSLGLFAFLDDKTDEIQKGLGKHAKGPRRA